MGNGAATARTAVLRVKSKVTSSIASAFDGGDCPTCEYVMHGSAYVMVVAKKKKRKSSAAKALSRRHASAPAAVPAKAAPKPTLLPPREALAAAAAAAAKESEVRSSTSAGNAPASRRRARSNSRASRPAGSPLRKARKLTRRGASAPAAAAAAAAASAGVSFRLLPAKAAAAPAPPQMKQRARPRSWPKLPKKKAQKALPFSGSSRPHSSRHLRPLLAKLAGSERSFSFRARRSYGRLLPPLQQEEEEGLVCKKMATTQL